MQEEQESPPPPRVMILGIGNLLFRDEGFGIRVISRILDTFSFPDRVSVEDGGVLGVNLLGIISGADHLIVVDAVRNRGNPGDLYRLDGKAVPERIRAKNSLHQVDFLEALTLCQALDKVPETVIIGVEPEDIETLSTELTPVVEARVEDAVRMVTDELDRLGVPYCRGAQPHVSCDPLQNRED
jgi:hydrogenase maturation protease